MNTHVLPNRPRRYEDNQAKEYRPINIGIIGLGFGSYGLTPAFRMDPRANVQAICSQSAGRAQEAAERLGIPEAYSDWRDLLANDSIDALAIATPPGIQVEIACEALDHGIPVFAEKPLAPDQEGSRAMMDRVGPSGAANMLDFFFPELTPWRKARQLLHDGAIGAITNIDMQWIIRSHDHEFGLTTWKTDSIQGGGALSHFGCHALYHLHELAGPIDSLDAAILSPPGYRNAGDTRVESTFRFATGIEARMTLDTASNHPAGHHVIIRGTEGAIALRNPADAAVTNFSLECNGQTLIENDSRMRNFDSASELDPRVSPVARLTTRFLDWIETGKPSRPAFQDGHWVQEIIAAMRCSDTQETTVTNPYEGGQSPPIPYYGDANHGV